MTMKMCHETIKTTVVISTAVFEQYGITFRDKKFIPAKLYQQFIYALNWFQKDFMFFPTISRLQFVLPPLLAEVKTFYKMFLNFRQENIACRHLIVIYHCSYPGIVIVVTIYF